MRICPFCKSNVEENWYYCRSCNKPLIANLESDLDRSFNYLSERKNYNQSALEDIEEDFDVAIIKDKEIDQKIKKINEILENKETLKEPIPGSLLLKKSSLYYKKRDLANAEKNLKLALKNFKEENDKLNIAICYNELGLIQEDNGFFDQAIYNFNRSLEILREHNDIHKIVMILNNLGNVYYLLKDLEHSYKYYQEALHLSEKENLKFEEIKSASNLVEVLFELKDFNRIERILDRNAQFFNENEDFYGIVYTQIKYGKLYFLQGKDYDLSYQHLKDALDLIKKGNSTVSIYVKAKLEWEVLYFLGKLQLLWENIHNAENLLLQSLEAVRIFGIRDNINEGKILEEIAKVYSVEGEDKRAVEFYKLSYDIYFKFGDNLKCAELKYKIAQLYSEMQCNESAAVEYFEEALKMYENLGHIKEVAILLHKLGDYYLHSGMTDLALPNFERARDYFKELEDNDNVNLLEEKMKSLTETY